MNSHGIIAWIIIGVVAGWLAGTLVKGGGFGLIGDIVVGIIGAFIGGWLAGKLGIHVGSGWIASIITATVGAVILIFVLRLFRRGG
ncbi:MAG TPA: GlsB/YeaQ/YmgE family stress response membrane protein [Caulobacteraceae bacterium]